MRNWSRIVVRAPRRCLAFAGWVGKAHYEWLPAVWRCVKYRATSQLGAVQEYGFHAGLEELMWATDSLNGGLSELNWDALMEELHQVRRTWTETILEHARQQQVFFPAEETGEGEEMME